MNRKLLIASLLTSLLLSQLGLAQCIAKSQCLCVVAPAIKVLQEQDNGHAATHHDCCNHGSPNKTLADPCESSLPLDQPNSPLKCERDCCCFPSSVPLATLNPVEVRWKLDHFTLTSHFPSDKPIAAIRVAPTAATPPKIFGPSWQAYASIWRL